MAAKSMTRSERDHMARVAELGCAICRRSGHPDTPALVHHLRSGTGLGRASHFDTMPLCHEHHAGNTGIHGMGRRAWERHFGVTEREILDETKKALGL
jgi:hypothetical protein